VAEKTRRDVLERLAGASAVSHFGAVNAGREDWLATWQKLDPDPQVEEIRRNLPIRQPVLWLLPAGK